MSTLNGHTPRTLMQAVRYFTPDNADAYVASVKWSDGRPVCPECGSVNAQRIKGRPTYQCRERECRKQFSLKVGTIFQDSPLTLDKWLVGIWMIANCRNGVSSCEIARALGIKQQSAWHLLHRVRHAMKSDYSRRMRGSVESDESFVGGSLRNKFSLDRKDRARARGKSVVHAMLKREGRSGPSEVRAFVIPAATAENVRANLVKHVKVGNTWLHTDESVIYGWASSSFIHRWVNHMNEYVRGSVHTNTVEGYFSQLRRMLQGTYIAVEPQHLHAYVDELSYRCNVRKESESTRFDRLVRQVIGKRLTYKDLTGGKDR